MENKNKFKVAVFCILSAFLGIILGYACIPQPKSVYDTENIEIILANYQDYYDTNKEFLDCAKEMMNEGTTLKEIESLDVYQELLWIDEIITKHEWQLIDADNELLERYYNYYYHTESLLDSLYEWQTDYFLDVVFETDAYDTYMNFKTMLNEY